MSKYNNKPESVDGHKFASRREAKRYMELKLLQRANQIRDLKIHPSFTVVPKTDQFRAVDYVADFSYIVDGRMVVEDAKGMRRGTAYSVFKIKQKLMYHVLGIVVIEV